MNITKEGSSRKKAYLLFERDIRAGLLSLKVRPKDITSRLSHENLLSFPAPVEFFEVEADFSGAKCLLSFCESENEGGQYSCDFQFKREGEETLYLSDYLANLKDQRQEFLRFVEDEVSIEAGIARMVEVVVAVLNEELLPVLKGQAWVTAPFDWGDYK